MRIGPIDVMEQCKFKSTVCLKETLNKFYRFHRNRDKVARDGGHGDDEANHAGDDDRV
jgi:hypothetical protein